LRARAAPDVMSAPPMVPRTRSWLPLTGLIALVAVGFGGLMLGLAGDHSGMQRLSAGVSILRETPGYAQLTPDAVAAMPDDAWQAWSQPGFPAGPAARLVWVRVTLRNDSPLTQAGVLADAERYADRADLYLRDETGAWRHLRSGEWTPARAKALWGREVAFPVSVPAGGTQTVYLRYEDRLALWLDFRWWAEAGAYHAATLRDIVAESVYFGTLLALLLYNLVLWVRVRFPGTGAYLLYLGTFMGYIFLARNELALLGRAIGSPWMEVAMTFSLALSGMFLAEFARQLLALPQRSPRGDRVVRGARLTMAVLALATLVAPLAGVMNILAVIVLASAGIYLVLLVVAATAWREGGSPARYFVLATGFLFAGLMPLLAAWVPAVSLETAGRIAMAGSALEMLLLSVAIADRFAGLQEEKITAQAEAMAETEKRRLIEEAYADELATEVRERTRELAAANTDKDRMLTVIGHDLRGPLASVTQTAELLVHERGGAAELEKFTADTAGVGRQMLLLIEDLVLWARLRAGLRQPRGRHTIKALVAPVAALHRAAAGRRGIRLTVSVPEDLRVATDLVPAQTLLRNLVANALKFARTEVTVVAAPVAAGVRLTVADDGPGLPPAVAEALAAAEPAFAGVETGLGLRLCAEIGRTLDASLAVRPREGGGTEFTFVLPRAEGGAVSP